MTLTEAEVEVAFKQWAGARNMMDTRHNEVVFKAGYDAALAQIRAQDKTPCDTYPKCPEKQVCDYCQGQIRAQGQAPVGKVQHVDVGGRNGGVDGDGIAAGVIEEVVLYKSLPAGTELYAAPPVPQGMALVPVELTEEMLEVIDCDQDWVITNAREYLKALWADLLSAAQSKGGKNG